MSSNGVHLHDGPAQSPQPIFCVRTDTAVPAAALHRGLARPPAALATSAIENHLDVFLVLERPTQVFVVSDRFPRDEKDEAAPASRGRWLFELGSRATSTQRSLEGGLVPVPAFPGKG